MSVDHDLAPGQPPPIERKQIALPAFGAIGVILSLVAMGRLHVMPAFIFIGGVVLVCSQIRKSEIRASQQRVLTEYYEAQRVAGERDYYNAQRSYFEQYGQYFDPQTYTPSSQHD